jgi:hypothetical protein
MTCDDLLFSQVDAAGGLEARFTVALPARGRSILGAWAAQILVTNLPRRASCPAQCSKTTCLSSLPHHIFLDMSPLLAMLCCASTGYQRADKGQRRARGCAEFCPSRQCGVSARDDVALLGGPLARRYVRQGLYYEAQDARALADHIACVEDTQALRDALPALGLVAFVGDGAVLPRRARMQRMPDAKIPRPPIRVPFHLHIAPGHCSASAGFACRRTRSFTCGSPHLLSSHALTSSSVHAVGVPEQHLPIQHGGILIRAGRAARRTRRWMWRRQCPSRPPKVWPCTSQCPMQVSSGLATMPLSTLLLLS